MRYKASTLRIIEKLKELYPEGLCSLQYEKDYELLFAVRLSAQCTDERVNKVTPALYARFPTLESFAEADPAEVPADPAEPEELSELLLQAVTPTSIRAESSRDKNFFIGIFLSSQSK